METPSPNPPAVLGSAANPILAAGVVLWRAAAAEPEFLLLQNRRHGTWSFAKGHLQSGESLVLGAIREVAEETGIVLTPADLMENFADTSIYQPDAASSTFKRVVYFLAARAITTPLQLSEEHQDSGWLTQSAAVTLLQHQDLKRTLLRAALRLSSLKSIP